MGNKHSDQTLLNENVCQVLKNQIGKDFSQFSLNLYKKLSNSSNLIFSPTSIFIALAMAALGSKGQTLQEFKDLLGFSDQSQLAESTGLLLKILQQNQIGITTQIANKIYSGLPQLGLEYQQLVSKHFDSMIQNVNFASEFEKVRIQINKWVSEVTKEKIKDLLPINSLSSSTLMVLVNAIYFKGNWLKKFDTKLTQKLDFHLEYENYGQKIQIDMMARKDEYFYFQNEIYSYAQIPYKGGQYFMELILPNQPLEQFEKKFLFEQLQEGRKNKYICTLNLKLPKFKIQPSQTITLNKILNELGLVNPFLSNADFSLIDPSKNISISDVYHKSMIEVNEEGAEAAAATAITFIECEKMELDMIFDKPFIYAITHCPSETILFMGKVTDPSKQG